VNITVAKMLSRGWAVRGVVLVVAVLAAALNGGFFDGPHRAW
jgi:hypothetical protein